MTFTGCNDANDDPQTEIPDTPDNPGGDDNDNDEPEPVNPGSGKILIDYFSRWGNTNYPADVDASTGASIIINNGNRRGTTSGGSRLYSGCRWRRYSSDRNRHTVSRRFRRRARPEPHRTGEWNTSCFEEQYREHGAIRNGIHRLSRLGDNRSAGYPLVPRSIRLRGENGRTVLHARRIRSRQQLSRHTDAVSGATVSDGLTLLASDVPSSESRVREWLERIGIEREEP